MKIFQGAALYALLLLLFAACKHDSVDRVNSRFVKRASADMELMDMKIDSTAQYTPPTQAPNPTNNFSSKIDWDKKIIKNGEINIEVNNYENFNSTLHERIKQFGGYIANEEQNQESFRIINSITIKVPVDQFDNAVKSFTEGGKRLNEKRISSEDVTSEVVDVKSRMEAKKQVRQRYLDLLKQARNMKEILEVQDEINDVQEEIESATGRLGYLNHSAVFSTIHLTFFQMLSNAPGKSNPTYWDQIKQAFRNGGTWMIEIIISLINLWPLILLISASIFIFRKLKIVKVNGKTVRT